MSVELNITGFDETLEFLGGIGARADSESFWNDVLGSIMEKVRRFAVTISPVVTGSYRDSHVVEVASLRAILTIDPGARNTASGVPVTQYALPVEDRHHVYGRAEVELRRVVSIDSDQILERLAV